MSAKQQRSSDKNIPANSHITNSAEDLLSVLSDGIIGINKNGNISFINKLACTLTGWNQADAIGQPLDKVFHLISQFSHRLDMATIENVIASNHLLGPVTHQVIKSKNDDEILVDFSISPLDQNTVILMFHNVYQDDDKSSRTLLYQVSYDPLTHITNRDALQQTLSHLHNDYSQTKTPYSLLLLDLDRFKLVNDSYGHKTGDQLLQAVASRMQQYIRGKDNIGRWGGEEFLCILPDTDLETATEVAERLREGIATKSFVLDSREIYATASIGIANYPVDGNSPDDLFRIADATLYEAKRSGRNRIQNSSEMSGSIYSIGTQLESALSDHRMVPVYQAIFDLQTGEQVAEEALARIQDGDSLIEAYRFIDAAVKLQLAHRVDFEIIKSTILRCSSNYINHNVASPHFVNVSADLLRHPELVQEILDIAASQCQSCGLTDCDKKPIVIEITEQELLYDVNETRRILAPFIDFGFPLAIDDFGSGYSSLRYLADLPITYLKFDGELIKRIAYEPRVRKIIEGIQRMADSLNLITIAEHIENEVTHQMLCDIGVSWGQGHFSAHPES